MTHVVLVTGNANEANFNLQLQLKNTYTSWARGALVGGVGGEGGGVSGGNGRLAVRTVLVNASTINSYWFPAECLDFWGRGGGGRGGMWSGGSRRLQENCKIDQVPQVSAR